MGKKNMLKPGVRPKEEAPKAPCRHQHLHFEAGGLYLVCDECKYAWAAVGFCPLRIIQDINARALGYSELDKRSDPLAPPRSTKP